jgi:hypothetical protein
MDPDTREELGDARTDLMDGLEDAPRAARGIAFDRFDGRRRDFLVSGLAMLALAAIGFLVARWIWASGLESGVRELAAQEHPRRRHDDTSLWQIDSTLNFIAIGSVVLGGVFALLGLLSIARAALGAQSGIFGGTDDDAQDTDPS